MKPRRPQSKKVAKLSKAKTSAGQAKPQVSPKPFGPVTTQWLDEVAAGTEKSIRDTPAWKEAVGSLGLKEARRRLRLHCLASQLPAAAPDN